MTTFNYPGHQRHIKKTIKTRTGGLRTKAQEAWNAEEQLRLLDLAMRKLRGEKLSEADADELYHPSFDTYAACILWHMPPEKYDYMLEQWAQLERQDPKLVMQNWIHPRVSAVKQMQMGLSGLISGPAAKLDLCWDDQIHPVHASHYGYEHNAWYQVSVLVPKQQEEPIMESESKQDPKPPVFTPPPVARPWWMTLIDKIRR